MKMAGKIIRLERLDALVLPKYANIRGLEGNWIDPGSGKELVLVTTNDEVHTAKRARKGIIETCYMVKNNPVTAEKDNTLFCRYKRFHSPGTKLYVMFDKKLKNAGKQLNKKP